MYKYEYARIKCNVSGYILTSGTVFELPDYKSIIQTKAEDGWRYVGYIPVKQRGTGHIEEFDLIFEKEEKE